jgi:hypothetical protein
MKKGMRAWVVAALGAVLLVPKGAAANPFQFPLKTAGRHLVDAQGRPVFFQADTATALFRLSREDALHYLRHRRIHGFTAVAAKLTAAGQRNHGGAPAFEGDDLSRPAEAYFEHADQIIRSAEALGLVLALSPADQLERAGEARARRYGRWLGQRYARHGHVVWVLEAPTSPEARALASGLRETARHHLIAGEDVAFVRAGDKRPAKPYVVAGVLYEGEPGGPTPAQVRRQAYATILGGATGHAYGSVARTFPPDWRGQLELPGGASLAHARRLFESRPWHALALDLQIVGDTRKEDPVTAARTPDGSLAVVYVPSPRKLTVHARRMSGRQIAAWWFDPRTGQARAAGVMSTTGSFPVVTPGAEDWVLVLDQAGRKLPPPGSDR